MHVSPTLLAVSLAVFAPMAIEARRAARNERAQRARGGIEPPGDVYAIMTVAYPLAFASMIAEGLWRGGVPAALLVTGAAVFAVAKALKWWAIVSLGRAWTFRVVVVPGMPRVADGPYKYFAHPNYIGVAGELIGVALMTGARVAGPIATVFFVSLMARRVAIERAALDAILRNS
jgi:methyltransferase